VKILLDENVSRRIAEALRKQGHDAVALTETPLGNRRTLDPDVVEFARREQRAIATYNKRDFAVLARQLAERGVQHWGIILIDRSTIRMSDAKRQIKALAALLARHPGIESLKDACVFLSAE
jgi:predicted nuclease of predicted toxin-antitoxin system